MWTRRAVLLEAVVAALVGGAGGCSSEGAPGSSTSQATNAGGSGTGTGSGGASTGTGSGSGGATTGNGGAGSATSTSSGSGGATTGNGGAGGATSTSSGSGGATTGNGGAGGAGASGGAGGPPPTCIDGVKNGAETDEDCGGSCPPCADGLACAVPADCMSMVCTNGACAAPTCIDGIENGAETDKDCGGSCPPCADGFACAAPADCMSLVCTNGACAAPTCVDGVKNGAETDKDCGGSCPPCADGLACAAPADCMSLVCANGACAAPTCVDGVKNGFETEVDCGGACGPCPGPSCAGGLDCGGVSCCQNLLVPGGTFPMGRSAGGSDACPANFPCGADEQPEHNVTVADYYLDTFEITVGRFRKFVVQYNGTPPAAGAGAHPLIVGSGWQVAWNASLPATQAALISNLKCSAFATWTDGPGPNESYAINCISWYEAAAFCAWDGGRMPTEAEWEYAAAGGSENRLFPWGSQMPDNTLAVLGCQYDGNPVTCLFADVAPVGSTPAGNGKWGHRDLAGGMFEWNLDFHDSGWYSGGGAKCVNCANLGGSSRSLRGGSWFLTYSDPRAASRDSSLPSNRHLYVGARCARSK